MTIYEQLCALDEYLSDEIRQFNESARTCDAKGAIKGTYYCIGVATAYENVLGRIRGIVPDELVKDVIG